MAWLPSVSAQHTATRKITELRSVAKAVRETR